MKTLEVSRVELKHLVDLGKLWLDEDWGKG